MTPDFHSLEITGGEPLLHADYIKEFLECYSYKAMLETNATLPNELEKLVDVIDIVSMDIKLPEHFENSEQWQKVYEKELESIKIMEKHALKYYLKFVVLPTTKISTICEIMDDLEKITSKNIEIIIQPVSPMSLWDDKKQLFKISEAVGSKYSVSIIPQIHKYMDIE